MQKKYEYKLEYSLLKSNVDAANRLGQEGWRLVSVFYIDGTWNRYFEREIIEPDTTKQEQAPEWKDIDGKGIKLGDKVRFVTAMDFVEPRVFTVGYFVMPPEQYTPVGLLLLEEYRWPMLANRTKKL